MKFMNSHKKIMAMLMLAMIVAAVGGGMAFAESTGTSAVNSAVTTALGTVQSDALSLIASVLPYALSIMGAIIVVMVGIKVFKRVAGR